MKPTTVLYRGRAQDPDELWLSFDRKVSPIGTYQASRDRWVPMAPNSFGLPAGISCPGRTKFCESCYAEGAEKGMQGVHAKMMHNFELLQEAGDVDGMAELLWVMVGLFEHFAEAKLKPEEWVFRIHWDGDFFSLDYARAWRMVMEDYPRIRFWAYTRSFIEPVNVVPLLVPVPNLALYLSVDAGNVAAARVVKQQCPAVRVALCDTDYTSARALWPELSATVCPENSGRMALMKDGKGACVACKLCPDAKRDIIFSTTHQEDAANPVFIKMPAIRSGVPVKGSGPTHCEYEPCGKPITQRMGKGRRRHYCDATCATAARRARVSA
jgi:hypothetical protein